MKSLEYSENDGSKFVFSLVHLNLYILIGKLSYKCWIYVLLYIVIAFSANLRLTEYCNLKNEYQIASTCTLAEHVSVSNG